VELYLLTSLARFPLHGSKPTWSHGTQLFKSLLPWPFRASHLVAWRFSRVVQSIAGAATAIGAIWSTIGYTCIVCVSPCLDGSLAKSNFGRIKDFGPNWPEVRKEQFQYEQ
jgi:hypothetical protein